MHRTTLDFVVIGAQKSGTTSLYKYLARHPQVVIPGEKEAPFSFADLDTVPERWPTYLQQFFGHADPSLVWGTVTPQYLFFPNSAEGLSRVAGDARLVAILRHPIERAVSQYRMTVGHAGEDRSFADAVRHLLRPENLDAARRAHTLDRDHETYVARGEYGRCLAEYLRWFDRSQLLVVLTEELADDPLGVWERIADHLGIDPARVPDNLEQRYFVGGTERKVSSVYALKRSSVARRLWHAVPRKPRRWFRYWFDKWNVVPGSGQVEVDAETHRMLVEHYEDDVALLEEIVGRPVPWPDLTSVEPREQPTE